MASCEYTQLEKYYQLELMLGFYSNSIPPKVFHSMASAVTPMPSHSVASEEALRPVPALLTAPSVSSPLEFPLTKALVGQWVRLGRINDDAIELLTMRLGLSEGTLLRIKAKVPAGPLVVVCGQTELALGRELCDVIPVHPLE